jgi:hypothetical protein
MNKKFRPQNISGQYKLKNNPIGQWHWVDRQLLSNHFQRMTQQLHYLACHAPLPVQKKWHNTWCSFEQKYSKKL